MNNIFSMKLMLAALALGMLTALSATDADARSQTVRVEGPDGKVEDVEVDWSRPGSNADNYTNLLKSILFPAEQRYDCVDADAQHTGWASAVESMLALLMGQNFCPNASQLERLASPCYGEIQFQIPRSVSRTVREGESIKFREVTYGRYHNRPRYSTVRRSGYVYFGWGDCWTREYFHHSVNSVDCSTNVFGRDPKPSVRKVCIYQRTHDVIPFEGRHFGRIY